MSKYMLGVVCPNHTVADVKLHGGVGINPAVHQSLYNCSYVRQLEVFSLFSSFSFERSLSLLTSLPRDRESASRLSNGSWSALGLLDLIRPFVVQRICLFSVAWRCLVNWCIQCRHGPIALIYIYIHNGWYWIVPGLQACGALWKDALHCARLQLEREVWVLLTKNGTTVFTMTQCLC